MVSCFFLCYIWRDCVGDERPVGEMHIRDCVFLFFFVEVIIFYES